MSLTIESDAKGVAVDSAINKASLSTMLENEHFDTYFELPVITLEEFIKLDTSGGLSAECDKYQHMLQENPNRFVLFPIVHSDIWEIYKQAQDSYWTAEEVDLSTDVVEWETRMKADERYFIENNLALFASADGIVNENLATRFMKEVQVPETRCGYGFQITMENIHGEMYSLLIDTLIKDPKRKRELFNSHISNPAVKQKTDWACKWMGSDASFAARLAAFGVVEGIFFSGSFCSIFWLKKRGLMPGLCFSNEKISADEGLHLRFAALLYSKLQIKLSDEVINQIVREAVEVEKKFFETTLKVDLIGMNSKLMMEYIEFVADYFLALMGHPKIYHTAIPFDWMESISLEGKTNMFEKGVAEYAMSSGSKRKNAGTSADGVTENVAFNVKSILNSDMDF